MSGTPNRLELLVDIFDLKAQRAQAQSIEGKLGPASKRGYDKIRNLGSKTCRLAGLLIC